MGRRGGRGLAVPVGASSSGGRGVLVGGRARDPRRGERAGGRRTSRARRGRPSRTCPHGRADRAEPLADLRDVEGHRPEDGGRSGRYESSQELLSPWSDEPVAVERHDPVQDDLVDVGVAVRDDVADVVLGARVRRRRGRPGGASAPCSEPDGRDVRGATAELARRRRSTSRRREGHTSPQRGSSVRPSGDPFIVPSLSPDSADASALVGDHDSKRGDGEHRRLRGGRRAA